ncbi:MAG: DNA topoisomerase IB [Pseudobdellovibrionaceae bacterium]
MTAVKKQDLEKELETLGLHEMPEPEKGYTRKKTSRDNFIYCTHKGKKLADKLSQRLQELAIPPSYKNVWYSPDPDSYILATGEDSTGKKQYIYHPAWRKWRDQHKFDNLAHLAENLPALRRHVTRHLKDRDDSIHFLLATMTKLLDMTGMRVGNPISAKKNGTYGLTTLKSRHIETEANGLYLHYHGKGGVEIKRKISNAKFCELLQDHMESPGKELFTYLCSHDKTRKSVSPEMLNRFIKSCIGAEFSAKDLRTWRFSVLFFEEALRQHKRAAKDEHIPLKTILEKVAEKTGNTPAILQQSYIHPGLIQIAKEEEWDVLPRLRGKIPKGLRQSEFLFAKYLKSKHAQAATSAMNI